VRVSGRSPWYRARSSASARQRARDGTGGGSLAHLLDCRWSPPGLDNAAQHRGGPLRQENYLPSGCMKNLTRSPGFNPRCSRIAFGIVAWSFVVIADSTIQPPLHYPKGDTLARCVNGAAHFVRRMIFRHEHLFDAANRVHHPVSSRRVCAALLIKARFSGP
jgi:hypothetical protein